MKFPDNCGFGNPSVASVPGYLLIWELDGPAVNQAVTSEFEANRGRGALWAFAIERGVGHVWVRTTRSFWRGRRKWRRSGFPRW